jgi:hypothetical protein
MKFLALVIFLCFYRFSAYAGEVEVLEQYYAQVFTGQHQTRNYQGPLSAQTKFNSENGQMIFLDDIFTNNFLQTELQSELFDLKDFWFNKLNDQSTCPDYMLGESMDYIRYLYRLTTISYLFESLKINHQVTAQLGGGKNNCSISYDELFGKCKPKTVDMQKFKERVYGKFVNEISRISYEPLLKSEITGWLTLFKRSSPDTLDPIFSRLHSWCKISDKKCDQLNLPEIKKTVGLFCEQDSNLIKNICDEQDELYGMSYIELSSKLVRMSNAFNLINGNGMGENCLRRYEKVFSMRENQNPELARLFPIIHAYLSKEKSRFLQGELFLPGALKEFDNKGLSDFLTALRPPVKPAVIVEKPKPVAITKKIIAKVEAVKPVEVVTELPAPVVVAEIPVVHVSEFERAVLAMKEQNLDQSALDMTNFQNDYEFTTKKISELAVPLRKFQTRKALKEMKTFDKLGAQTAPLGLIFIKFLIDTENHQGLYNVVSELGEKFFVHNDLEDKKDAVYVELKNNAATKNKWQLTLIRPQKNSGAR